jgi:hypothetical protein
MPEPMTLEQWLLKIYPLLKNHTLTRADHVLTTGEVIKAYWAGAIIRIDIKPVEK